ncbi:MAG: SGNH/GDSL hydrolase family protein, partial [Phycisphaerales bacterium]|nr:SGNH/GDSL hydrolase family protein [Phycisphaerales bacterium]
MKLTPRRILILLFIPVWSLFASEMWMRILDPVPILPRYIEASDFGIRVNMPGETYVHRSAEYRVEIRTNSKGVRADVEYAIPKPDGVFRVIVLGDSFGMGYGSNIEESSLRVLETTLADALGRPVEVINLSVSGHGNAEELLMLRHEGLAYEPDAVVVMYTTTDPDDNVRSGLFRLDESGALVAARTEYLPAVRTREMLYAIPMYRWVAGNSHLYNQVREVAARHAKTVLGALASRRSGPAPTSTDGPTRAERLTVALLKEIERVARDD